MLKVIPLYIYRAANESQIGNESAVALSARRLFYFLLLSYRHSLCYGLYSNLLKL